MKLSLILVWLLFEIQPLISEVVLTPDTNKNSYAYVAYNDDTRATPKNGVDANRWKVFQGSAAGTILSDWALSLTLDADEYGFKSGYAASTLEISLAGTATSSDCDVFLGFSIGGDEYFTFSTNADSGGIGIAGRTGTFFYPACSGNVAAGDVSTLIQTGADLRNDLAGGNEADFALVGGLSGGLPFKFVLTNDDISDTFTVQFISPKLDYSCAYSGAVATGQEFKMHLQLDFHDETLFLESITVDSVNLGISRYEIIAPSGAADAADVEAACLAEYGTNGASVHNAEEFNTVYDMCSQQAINLNGAQVCCLGGDDVETQSVWLWNDGSGDFSPPTDRWPDGLWAVGQPNNGGGEDYACVATAGGTANWNKGLHDCTTNHPCYPICNAPPDSCGGTEAGTFDWDTLTADGLDEPAFTCDMTVDADLSLNIHVELDYLGFTSGDDNGKVYGTTYVLDFEDFDAHKHDLSAPGSCENRVSGSFAGKAFSEWWEYSENPAGLRQIGEAGNFLAYPPTDTSMWTISMKTEDECGTVVYDGDFTWDQLVNCDDGTGLGTSIETVSDDYDLTLTGVFYINVVSPYDYGTNLDYYRVYQLLSKPFIISVSRSVYVLGETGINVLTMSVIAVYKEDSENTFRLILLTESSDYLQLARSSSDLYLFEPSDGGTISKGSFTAKSDAVTKDEQITGAIAGCLNNKAFICSQLWEITAENVECAENEDGINFSGRYALQFDTSCRAQPDISADLATHCTDWLALHPDIDGPEPVTLYATLTWKDEICDPQLFETQFGAEMQFYTDSGYSVEAGNTLYEVGVDPIYVKITTNYPQDTYEIFDTELINVWICTFDPTYSVDLDEFTGGCFDTNRDDTGYVYNIYKSDNPLIEEEGFVLGGVDGSGHPSLDGSAVTRVLEFYFKVPPKIQRDTLWVHAQIDVALTNGNRRRLAANAGAIPANEISNQMQHFVDNIAVGHGRGNKPPPQQPFYQRPNYQQPQQVNYPNYGPAAAAPSSFVVSLSSPWVIAIGGFLAAILVFNIVFMCYMNCRGRGRGIVGRASLNRRRRSGYTSVKNVDSEDFNDSEVNAINVE